jgi:serine/threonine protein kinase
MADRTIAGRYRLVNKLLPGNAARGVPELWHAQDAGDAYFAKLWARNNNDGGAIQALWNREVRSLSRLQGYPGAHELFVRLYDLGATDEHYYAILDGGRRGLLSGMLKRRSNFHWLLNLSEVGRPRPLWEGLLRVAEALSVLHAEGTLHRSLSSSSVFSGPDGGTDFRLSGFEWSLRVASSGGAASSVNLG